MYACDLRISETSTLEISAVDRGNHMLRIADWILRVSTRGHGERAVLDYLAMSAGGLRNVAEGDSSNNDLYVAAKRPISQKPLSIAI